MRKKVRKDPLDILLEWANTTPGVSRETRQQIEIGVYKAREAERVQLPSEHKKMKSRVVVTNKFRPVTQQDKDEAKTRVFSTYTLFYDSLVAPARNRLMPLIRAFLLRNTEFLAAFDLAMQEKSPERKQELIQKLGEKWKVSFNQSRLHKWQQGVLLPFTIRPGVVSVRLADPRDKATWKKLQDGIDMRAAATTPETFATAFARDYHFPTDCTPEWIASGLLGLKDANGHFVNAGHTLLFAVDFRRPLEETIDSVRAILQQHREQAKVKEDFGNWRRYLLAYDLHAVLGSYEKCADFFGQVFPSDNTILHLQERENVRRHCRKAKELIAGGYRDYLI